MQFGAGPFEQAPEKGGAENLGDALEKLTGRMFRPGPEPLLMPHANLNGHTASFS